jgi:ATP-dependent helicase HrpB
VTGTPDRTAITAALKAEIEVEGLSGLNWGERSAGLRSRLAFLHSQDPVWPDVGDTGLIQERENWLWPLLDEVHSLGALTDAALEQGLRALIPWDRQRALDQLAPARLATPLGSAMINYSAEGGPRVDIRVQELFGVVTHPAVMEGRVPLTLALLSPARRPIQMTKDLPGFWGGSWKDVRSEMRGRYPRHPWPENPAEAPATNRVKPRGS